MVIAHNRIIEDDENRRYYRFESNKKKTQFFLRHSRIFKLRINETMKANNPLKQKQRKNTHTHCVAPLRRVGNGQFRLLELSMCVCVCVCNGLSICVYKCTRPCNCTPKHEQKRIANRRVKKPASLISENCAS